MTKLETLMKLHFNCYVKIAAIKNAVSQEVKKKFWQEYCDIMDTIVTEYPDLSDIDFEAEIDSASVFIDENGNLKTKGDKQ